MKRIDCIGKLFRDYISESRTMILIMSFFLCFLAIVYLVVHLGHPANPLFATGNSGWNGWWDQSQYLLSATSLAHGELSQTKHWYPLGYAVLGVPFVYLLPEDPFLFVNLLATLIFAWAFVRYFERYIGRIGASLVFIVALAIPYVVHQPFTSGFPVWSQFAVPWNTVPTAAAYMVILVLMRDIGEGKERGRDIMLGLCAAVILVHRPIDVLPLIIVGFAYLWMRLVRRRSFSAIGKAVFGAGLVLLPVLCLMFLIYGGLDTPYSQSSVNIGFGFTNLLQRAHWILIDAATTWGEPHTIFNLQPWLYIAVPAAFIWAALEKDALLPVALAAASVIVYLTYNDFSPHNIIRFWLIHYIAWTLPVFAAAGVAGFLLLFRQRRWLLILMILLAAVALASYRVKPVSPPNVQALIAKNDDVARYRLLFEGPERIDAIDLVGAEAKDQIGITVENLKVRVDGKPLALFSGYRAISLPGGVRVIFNRHVVAQAIEFELGPMVAKQPTTSGAVVPVRFEGYWVWFWHSPRMANITSPW